MVVGHDVRWEFRQERAKRGRVEGRGKSYAKGGARHLLEARALVSGGCSCSASENSALVLLPARFNFSREALTSPCHRTKNMARCTRANIHPSRPPLYLPLPSFRPLFVSSRRVFRLFPSRCAHFVHVFRKIPTMNLLLPIISTLILEGKILLVRKYRKHVHQFF